MSKSLKIVVVLVAVALHIPVRAQDITTGLVAHWSFCGCNVKDQSGHGHDGTVSNNPACVAGIYDDAFKYDGNSSIDIPYGSDFNIDPSGQVTLSAWVFPTNVNGSYQALVLKGSDFWDYGLYIDRAPSHAFFGCNWPNHLVFSKAPMLSNRWYFLVGVYDNHDWRIYVNGVCEDSVIGGPGLNQSTNGFGFGKKGNYSKDMFSGILDEIRVYRRALSAADVAALYQYKPSAGTVTLSAPTALLPSGVCSYLDTSLYYGVTGTCQAGTATIDSVWLNGSSAFTMRAQNAFPRTVTGTDSIPVRYAPNGPQSDTTRLFIRYTVGNTTVDTSFTIVGPGQVRGSQHLAVRSGVNGDIVTLPMSVDVADSNILRNSWSILTSVTYEISFDRSKLSFQSVSPPTGWSVGAINTIGNNTRIILNNYSANYTRPFALGDAIFKIINPTQGMSIVTLQQLSLRVGASDDVFCLSQSEDALWGIVVKPPQSDVSENDVSSLLTVHPNPFEDHITISDEANDISSVELIDILGHSISTVASKDGLTRQIATDKLPSGSYLLVCHTPSGIKTFRLNKLH